MRRCFIAAVLVVPMMAAAQLAPLTVNVNDTFEGEPAVRVSVPELTLKKLKGKTFYFGACFRSVQGGWSEWVTTQQWSVPADPFKWKSAFSHLFRASRLVEDDFANGAFIARVSVFDGTGRELASREAPFQLGSVRDCGTGQDLGCSQTRDGVFALDRASYLGLIDTLRAEKNEKKRVKKFGNVVASVYLTAAQFTSLLDLFPGDGPRFEAATAGARRVVNLNDAASYAGRFKAPDLREKYGSLLRSLAPDAQPRAWRVEGDIDHVGFTFEEPTREAVYEKCVAWKEGNIRIQGFVTRVAIKGGATRTDMLRTDAACNAVKDGAAAVY